MSHAGIRLAEVEVRHCCLLLFYRVHERICPALQGGASHTVARRSIAYKRSLALSLLIVVSPRRARSRVLCVQSRKDIRVTTFLLSSRLRLCKS